VVLNNAEIAGDSQPRASMHAGGVIPVLYSDNMMPPWTIATNYNDHANGQSLDSTVKRQGSNNKWRRRSFRRHFTV